MSATDLRPVSSAVTKVTHFAYLDGLRGVTALYIVLYHAQTMITGLPKAVDLGLSIISLGRFSVTVFIVLSGYCLMLPVVRSVDHRLSGGFMQYLKRRALRILPPYYLALGCSLLLLTIFPNVHVNKNGLSNFSAEAIIPHLFLIHNFRAAWAYAINPPLWSVATEWQIYFFFPLLLLPLWKKWGIVGTLAIAFVVGLLPFYLMKASDLASPWFLGVFATGMCGAVVSFSTEERFVRMRSTLPWGKLSTALLIAWVLFVAGIKLGGWEDLMRLHFRWVMDAILGFAVTFLLIDYTKRSTTFSDTQNRSEKPPFLRLLETRAALTLGAFSYSLYLVHNPLIETGRFFIGGYLKPVVQLVLMLGVVVPVTLVLAYLFYRAFEQPFLVRRRTRQKPLQSIAVDAVGGQ